MARKTAPQKPAKARQQRKANAGNTSRSAAATLADDEDDDMDLDADPELDTGGDGPGDDELGEIEDEEGDPAEDDEAGADEDDEDEGDPAEGDEDEDEDDPADDELDDDELDIDADPEPEAEADPEPEAAPAKRTRGKGGKAGKAKAEPDPEPAADEGGMEVEYAPGFDTILLPVDELKPNKVRTPTEDAVAAMARSIREHGLQNPVVVDEGFNVVQGNTRLAAFRKLGRKQIPARIAVNKAGERVAAKDALFLTLAENLHRTNVPPLQLAKVYRKALDDKLALNEADLAKKLGLAAGQVNRTLSLAEGGTKALHAAIEEGKITFDAAATLVARTKGVAKEIDEFLAAALAAAEGKRIVGADVDRAKPASRKAGARGRRPSSVPLDDQALRTEETKLTGKLRLGPEKDTYTVELTIQVDHAGAFSRFDLPRKVQVALAKLDLKTVRTELEAARQRLTD